MPNRKRSQALPDWSDSKLHNDGLGTNQSGRGSDLYWYR